MLAGYRPGQLVARGANRLRRRIPLALAPEGNAPPFDDVAVARLGARAAARFANAADPREVMSGALTLLGRREALPIGETWRSQPPDRSLLWAFHLHYHEFLVPLLSAGTEGRETLVCVLRDWLRDSPPTGRALGLGWHPYVISCRVLPWAAVISSGPDRDLRDALAGSLWRQLKVLRRHLERDVGGNHLVRNAKALAVGGALFRGPEADAMHSLGSRLMVQLLADQLGPDGGHLEGSPTYHALVLEDALDTLHAEAGPWAGEIREAASGALGWLQAISPAGAHRPHFNDSHDEGALATASLSEYASDVDVRPTTRNVSPGTPRYIVLGGDRSRLVFDAAQPARRDMPYHAHADSLGITLDILGQPVIVDRGVATYAAGPERAWWRSTAAHSTVEFDGTDSSEMIGAFRAGRLAKTDVQVDSDRVVEAAHDGAGRPHLAHSRRVSQVNEGAWHVADAVPGASGALWRLHFAPGCAVVTHENGATVRGPGFGLEVRLTGAASIQVEQTLHAVAMGITTPAPTLVARFLGPTLSADIAVAL